ncbi:DarT ssDNA thymidine ADP-ribosyltransferase family protein [Sphingomonas lutea]|uniref:DarT ssDNA thymidine ADP-ribosyltransferase family protein n=1 Tax=Sphingomonas lutea TaxID=1045317 RepID=UPI003CC83500
MGNATAVFTEFRSSRRQLGELRWDLIPQRMFTDPQVKEAKQSELLVRDFFPWTLVDRIGTHSDAVANQVAQLLAGEAHRPTVQRMPAWYY